MTDLDWARVAPEWDELASRVGAAPCLRPGWVEAWWNAFGSGRLDLVAVRRGGRLVGVVPVAHRVGALTAPTNWHTPEFGLLAEDEGARRDLAGALAARCRGRLDLSFVTSEADVVACTEAGRHRSRLAMVRVVQRSPYVNLTDSFDEYLGNVRRSQLADVRRRRRRLEEVGRLEFSFEEGGDRLEERLEEMFRVEASGWKGRAGVAIASDQRTAAFYTDVARWAAERGYLRLAFLRQNGVTLAALLQVESNGVSWGLKTGYDEAYRRFAPGLVLLVESLAHYHRAGVHRFELLGDADAHKAAWATGIKDKVRVQLFSRLPAGLAQYGAFRFGHPAVKRALELLDRRGGAG